MSSARAVRAARWGRILANAGKDVTFLARGAHFDAMRKQGFRVIRPAEDIRLFPVSVESAETYRDAPDVVFVCVKGDSLPEITPFVRRIARENTVVIPLLNLYGTGRRMQKELPEPLVTDGHP